ncbi:MULTISPECIES: phospholipase A [unclassified Psychrobacter]|uniref:phospholipase A n=1 Tax=unclassified Psychrobacter TaxID=196806 RepID=UPI0018F69B45|nr:MULTISPECIES: phospholipase A [unclassified Psychrobacter]
MFAQNSLNTARTFASTFAPRRLSLLVAATLFGACANAAAVDDSAFESDIDTQTAITATKQLGATGASQSTQEATVAQQTKLFMDCAQVQTDAARLACFDKITRDGEVPSYTANKQPLDLAETLKTTFSGNPQVVLVDSSDSSDKAGEDSAQMLATVQPINTNKDDQKILQSVGVSQSDIEKYTPLSQAYDLDKNSERGTWSARPHRPMYLLPLFYSINPNRNPSTPNQEEVPYTDDEMNNTELKLQVSLKTKVAEDLFGTNADMWFGYTQQSHWQVYNAENSRPFRATDYEPEIFVTQPVSANLPFGGRLRMLGAGASHHSNGQSDPLSRSWNRLYLMGGAEWGKFAVIPRVWTRIKTENGSDADDNPDIEDYMGYGDVTFMYDLPDRHSVSGTVRYNPKTEKGGMQLDYVYPLSDNINGYVQLFHGYGESIIDYNHKNTAVGMGIVLNDWKGF